MALNYPTSKKEWDSLFPDEQSCLLYLEDLRWADGFMCPGCGGRDAWRLRAGVRQCTTCNRRVTVTSGTLLHRTRKPVKDWMEASWHICNQKYGGNALGLQRTLAHGSYHTSWEWLHRMRHAMVIPGRSLLNGEVEVDETFLGGVKSGKRGRGARGKSLVLVAAEVRGTVTGRIRLKVIPNATADTLLGAIAEIVDKGSNIVTDGLSSYAGLTNSGYDHTVSRYTPEIGKNLLPHVHRVAALLKRWLLGTHQGSVSHDRLQSYLDEFVFRFNRRTSEHRGLLFRTLWTQIVRVAPISRQSL